MKTVQEIVSDYLEANGYDGLYDPDGECGCTLGDFMLCLDPKDCVPAYRQECSKCEHDEGGPYDCCEYGEGCMGCSKQADQPVV